MELGPKQKEWIDALRSRKFKQGCGKLYDEANDTYCCLGVAAKLFDFDGVNNILLSADDYQKIGLRTCNGASNTGLHKNLATLNDENMTFLEIADILEKNPEEWFTSSL